VLASSNAVLDKVNDRLANLSIADLRALQDGDGVMSTLRKGDASSIESDGSSRTPVSIPTLNFGSKAFTDSLDEFTGGSNVASSVVVASPSNTITTSSSFVDNVGAESSWLDLADEGELTTQLAGGSSIIDLAGGNDNTTSADAVDYGDWEEYFDDEVGANYYFNTVTGEAKWYLS
jgi:hypothetical protein